MPHPIHRRSGARGRATLALAIACTLASTGTAAAAAGPAPVLLRTAAEYGVLAGSAMTNTGESTIVGDVGSSPTHTQTGFGPCPAANCVNLTGANHDVADPNDATTQQAKTDLLAAYDDAFGRSGGTAIPAAIGIGQTLVPGLYTAAVGIAITGDLTLDAGGDPDAVWIFQAKTGDLTTAAGVSAGTPNARVLLTNGAQACNVFWQVGTSATLGTSTRFVGNVLAAQSITVDTGATIDGGRALASNGATTLDTTTIKKATCAPPPPAGTTPTPTPTPAATPTPTPDAAATPTATTPTGSTPAPSPSAPSPTSVTSDEPTPVAATRRGTARLTGSRTSASRPFDVAVRGRNIDSVTFFVDGRRVSTVRARPGRTRFGLTVDPRRQSRRVHRVTAVVRFTPASRTRDRTIRFVYRRAIRTPDAPRFTG